MDPRRFDHLARSLARPASRRDALGVLGGALALVGEVAPALAKRRHPAAGQGAGAAAGQQKYVLCHKGHEIEAPASAVPAHFAHGDTPGLCPEPGFGGECVPLLHICNNNGNACCGANADCVAATTVSNALTFCLDRAVPPYNGCSTTTECQARFPDHDIVCASRGILTCQAHLDTCCQPKTCDTDADCPLNHTCCPELGGKHCCGPNQVCQLLVGCRSLVP